MKLQRFGTGRDGGIDLTEDSYKKSIIIYDINVGEIVENYRYEENGIGFIDSDAAIEEVDRIVKEYVLDDIYDELSQLSDGICDVKKITDNLSVYVSGSSSMVEAHLTEDYPDYYYDEYRERDYEIPEIVYIFER